MVGVVVDDCTSATVGFAQMELEASLGTFERVDCVADCLGRDVVCEVGGRGGCNGVVDVYVDRFFGVNLRDEEIRSDDVEGYVSVAVNDVQSVKVACMARVSESSDSGRGTWPQFEVGMDDKGAFGVDQRGEMGETFKVLFFSMIDVEVIGLG